MKRHLYRRYTVELAFSPTVTVDLYTQRFYVSLGTTVYSLTRGEFEIFLEDGAATGYADPAAYGKPTRHHLRQRTKSEDLWRGFPRVLARNHVCVEPTNWPQRRWRGALNALRAAQWQDLYFNNWDEPREGEVC